MNNVSLVGRLTRDPELRYTPSGTAACSFTLAVDDPFAKGDKKADFLSIVVWGKSAESSANYLKKGHLTGVTGRISTRNYEKDGRKIYITEIVANDVRFLEPKGQRNENGSTPPADEPPPLGDDDLPF